MELEALKQLLASVDINPDKIKDERRTKIVTIQGIVSGAPLSAARIASITLVPFFLIVEI